MKVINLPQGSDEWLDWRRGGVTASDAAVLVLQQASPYKTYWRLWAEKTGFALEEDLSNNPLVRHGKKYEDEARQMYESKHSDMLLPVCVESSENPLLRASLDGLDGQNRPVELKCPTEKTFNEVKSIGEGSEAYQLYYYQVQHQLLVTGAANGVLAFWFDGELLEFPINSDLALHKEIEAQAAIFWEFVTTKKSPPKDPLRDLYIPSDSESAQWISWAEQYIQKEQEVAKLKEKMALLQKEQKPLLDEMKSLMGDFYHADYAGLMITRYQAAGRVDYAKAIEKLAPNIFPADLDAFRKESSDRYRVTVTGRLEPKNVVDEKVIETLNIPKVDSFYF